MIIMIAAEKGGVGKTMIATNLAVACLQAGQSTLLIDTDPQGTALHWQRRRQDNNILPHLPVTNMSGRIGMDVIAMSEKFDVVIVDAGGRDSLEIRQCAAVCDLWIVPTSADQSDMESLVSALHICTGIERETGSPPNMRILINKAATLPTIKDADEASALLAADEDYRKYMPLLKLRLHSRVDYARAQRPGQSVIEYAPDGKAADEIRWLYDDIFSVQIEGTAP